MMIARILPVPEKGAARPVVFSGFVLNAGAGLQEALMPFFLLKFSGASVVHVGAVLTMAAVGAVLAVLPAGYLCERAPVGRMIVVAGAIQALATLALLITDSTVIVACILIACAMLAQVARIARTTVIVSLAPQERSVVLAQFGIWSNLGVGVGMAATVFFLWVGERWAYNLAFLITAGCFVGSALLRSSILPRRRMLDGAPPEQSLLTAMRVARNLRHAAMSMLNAAVFIHQVLLTVGVSLVVAADDNLPDWLVGFTLGLNLAISILLQSPVAARVKTAGNAMQAWSASAALSAVGVLVFGVGAVGAWPTTTAVTIVVVGILVLSLAELWYVAGQAEMSLLHGSSKGQATSQAVFLLGRDLGAMFGPLLIAALITTHRWFPWLVSVVAFMVLTLLLQGMRRRWERRTAAFEATSELAS